MRLLIAAALVGSFAAAGCQSDESLMAQARNELADTCRRSPPAGLDADRYCSCVVDKAFGGRTPGELSNMTEKQGQELGMQAGAQCMAEVGGAQAAPLPAGAAADGQAKAGEATEEAVDEAN